MAWLFCICLAAPFLMSVVVTRVVRRWALRRGFVDRPGGHKQHDRPVALGGGIAITVSLIVPLAAALALAWAMRSLGTPSWLPASAARHLSGVVDKTPAAAAILLGAIVLHVLGLVDDRRPLPALVKLAFMILVASVLVVGFDIRAMTLLGPALAGVVTVVWIVGITNAFNLMDNMDGLAGGVACVAGAIFAVSAVRTGQIFVPAVTCMLIGSVAGFLLHNFPPATIFMGDSGSLVIGYMLAVVTVMTTFVDPASGGTPFGMLAPVVVLAVPIYDTASVIWLRRRSGARIFQGDRRHFSHRLVQRGMSQRAAVLTIYLASAATGLSAIMLGRATWTEAVLVGIQCLAVVLIIALLERAPRHDA
ncbi:MAG: undecaprenyl/decaprenyl-phosphate alpha-N-acetylglucosaminyl 1-phosphate transferase [Phycisphaerae bacterium]|nr:undecaprenyl/decaprenyl-phosphate alpha-N-acetylglucosaminyl 1-phosphate transferase [Phycisphaerae bacterium]